MRNGTPATVELLLLRALVKATDEWTARLDRCEKRVDMSSGYDDAIYTAGQCSECTVTV